MQGAAIFRCPLIATALFHALCGAQRSSASLPTDGAERALDFSTTMRYNSGTRTPRSRYHIIGKTGKKPTKYKEITPNTTFVKFHRTVPNGMTIAASIRENVLPHTVAPTLRSRLFIFSFYDQISCKRSKIWYDEREIHL